MKKFKDYDIRQIPFGIFHMYRNYKIGKIFFEHNQTWDVDKKSSYIQSIFLNIPLSSMLFENHDGNYLVLDGKERILAINEFFEDNLKLVNLKILEDFNGCTYSNLLYYHTSFEDKYINVNVIPNSVPDDIVSYIMDIVK